MRPERAAWQDEKTVKPKTCGTCGQTLPLKIGDYVEGKRFYEQGTQDKLYQGQVTCLYDGRVEIAQFQTGAMVTLTRAGCVRLHGYFHILEREKVV